MQSHCPSLESTHTTTKDPWAPQGPKEDPCTHIYTQPEWKRSHHLNFLIWAVRPPPPLHYLSFCLLMSSTSFFVALLHFTDSCYLLHLYFFSLPLFFINFWLSLASIPGGVVWNARHFWATAKQMQAPLLSPMIWTSFLFRSEAEFQLSCCKM